MKGKSQLHSYQGEEIVDLHVPPCRHGNVSHTFSKTEYYMNLAACIVECTTAWNLGYSRGSGVGLGVVTAVFIVPKKLSPKF